jgi:ABC-type uncharacterized transport system involved in gliding motility auxiliary subunit
MQHYQTSISALVAILGFAIIIVFSNTFFKSARLDLTEQQLFTLSEGSKAIVEAVKEPIHVYFYFSEESSRELTQLRTYAARVEALLEEYASHSKGNIVVTRIDPEPFSEAEDDADAYGLQKVPVGGAGDGLYFGIVANNALDGTEVISFLQPDKEAFLEYDISQMLFRLSQAVKPKIGLFSALPVKDQVNPQTFQMQPGWQSIKEIEQLFEVVDVDAEATTIDADINLLLLIHPKTVSESLQNAIRAYLARGGALIGFIDPLAELDQQGGNPMTPSLPVGQASDLNWLTADWGVRLSESQVLGDAELALSVAGTDGAPQRHLAILGLGPNQISDDEVMTAGLESINVSSAGLFEMTDPKVDITSVLSSSIYGAGLPKEQLQFLRNPRDLEASYTPGTKPLEVAIALRGVLPRSMVAPKRDESSGEGEVPSLEPSEALDQAEQVAINVLLISDTDLLSDRLWVQVQNFFGQQVATAWADNGSFLVNAVDYMVGSADLIQIRSRGRYTRPFEVVQNLKRDAEAKYLDSANQLQLELTETEQRLAELESQQVAEGLLTLSPEQAAALESFQQEKLRIRKELRDVRHGLDKDIEGLGANLKLINIGLLPLLLTLLMGFAAWNKTTRQARRL